MTQNETINILIVDDESLVRDVLCRILATEGYNVVGSEDGERALTLLESTEFHLVVSDIMMPGMSGLDLLEAITRLYPEVAVLMLTGMNDRNVGKQALRMGAYGYLIKPFRRNEVTINVANALQRRKLNLLSAQREKALADQVQESIREVRAREQEMVLRILSAVSHRDQETGTHTRRVGLYASVIAAAIGWETEQVNNIRLAAPLHDVGKVGIPDNILLKPGRLTAEEFDIMKKHCTIGAKMLDGTPVAPLRIARNIALSHHERWDGSGYPHGLCGEAIPECARVVAIVDVYDALVHDRIYRPAFPEHKAVSIMMEDNRKGLYDPKIFEAFLDNLPQMRTIRNAVKEPNVQELVPDWRKQVSRIAS